VVLGEEGSGGTLGLEHDFVLLFQLLFEKTHWCEFTRRPVVLDKGRGFRILERGDAPYVGGESSEGDFHGRDSEEDEGAGEATDDRG
jgi:hypothetical protein